MDFHEMSPYGDLPIIILWNKQKNMRGGIQLWINLCVF